MAEMGYGMVLYPTTVIFRAACAIQEDLAALRRGEPLDPGASLDTQTFEDIIDLQKWAAIERDFRMR